MSHPIEAVTAQAFERLRALQRDGAMENDESLCDGVSLSWDEAGPQIRVEAISDAGRMLALKAEVQGAPRWFSLNIPLGKAALRSGDVIGVVLDAQADTALPPVPLFVRSARDGETVDTHLTEPLTLASRRGVAVTLHRVEADSALHGTEDWHTLILSLPAQDFGLTLFDARVFVSPAG